LNDEGTVIKKIQRIQGLGVFSNYRHAAATSDFSQCNLIYGWNYSGKTTLSRLFHVLETKQMLSSSPNLKFSIELDDTSSFTETSLSQFSTPVAVFNSDFVESNLSWKGDPFAPILLLGATSKEFDEKISRQETKLQKLRARYSSYKKKHDDLEEGISERKTREAREIKTRLSLSETFTSTHLDSAIRELSAHTTVEQEIDEQTRLNLLRQATMSEADAKDIHALQVAPNKKVSDLLVACRTLLTKEISFAGTIEFLRENQAIASWIESGLPFHNCSETCHYCGNPIDEARSKALRDHFSSDLRNYKEKLNSLLLDAHALLAKQAVITKDSFYASQRKAAIEALSSLTNQVKKHNEAIEQIKVAISAKINTPFDLVDVPVIATDLDEIYSASIQQINDVITACNSQTRDIKSSKTIAINKLKWLYTREFVDNIGMFEKSMQVSSLRLRLDWCKKTGERAKKRIADLQAEINRAQQGREAINKRIADFLGSARLCIEVVETPAGDRFTLMRNGQRATQLSEGEKTAIAFAFFITKLQELPHFGEAVVVIDDPISSLDSNHIFQINAIIRDVFAYWDHSGASPECKLKCKQLFISTHNFEFLGLLKELPFSDKKKAFFLTKRVSESESTFNNLPKAIKNYSSEYMYLYAVLREFHFSNDKQNFEQLLILPNAIRRFVELYTYARKPTRSGNGNEGVDRRAEAIFGATEARRILKVLHYFSHSNSMDRLARFSDLICDVENAVADLMIQLQKDSIHYEALEESVRPS
jgi:wobble nucleotide-excising tRNase